MGVSILGHYGVSGARKITMLGRARSIPLSVMAAAALAAVSAGCGGEPRIPAAPLPDLAEVPTVSTRLSPDEAYAAIPHRRTVIDLDGTALDEHERR